VIYANLSRARELQDKLQLKKAVEIYTELLGMLGGVDHKAAVSQQTDAGILNIRQVLFQQLGVIRLHNKQATAAADHFQVAVELAELSAKAPGGVKTEPKAMSVLRGLFGKALYHDDNPEAAIRQFDIALGHIGLLKKHRVDRLNLKAWKARALYAVGSETRSEAIKILETLLKVDEQHVGALTLYAQVTPTSPHLQPLVASHYMYVYVVWVLGGV